MKKSQKTKTTQVETRIPGKQLDLFRGKGESFDHEGSANVSEARLPEKEQSSVAKLGVPTSAGVDELVQIYGNLESSGANVSGTVAGFLKFQSSEGNLTFESLAEPPVLSKQGKRRFDQKERSGRRLLTKEELRRELNLDSPRTIDALVRRRKIPVVRLGYRTRRFDLAAVLAALEKLEIKEVGRK